MRESDLHLSLLVVTSSVYVCRTDGHHAQKANLNRHRFPHKYSLLISSINYVAGKKSLKSGDDSIFAPREEMIPCGLERNNSGVGGGVGRSNHLEMGASPSHWARTRRACRGANQACSVD